VSAPVGGGGSKILASNLDQPYHVAVDAQNAYWTNMGLFDPSLHDKGSVARCPLAGCPAGATVLADKLDHPSAIAVDDKAIYWVTYSEPDGAVMKLAK
jgi:hypothetical protein